MVRTMSASRVSTWSTSPSLEQPYSEQNSEARRHCSSGVPKAGENGARQ